MPRPAPPFQAHGLEDTTYVYDLGNTVRLFRSWRAAMPRVAPFYAVKCNPEPAILRLLAALGAGFDCASKAELEAVLSLGVSPDRVIFAHPCKRLAELRYAADVGVGLTTFDTEGELAKVAAAYPGVGLVMRVRCDDPEVRRGAGRAGRRPRAAGAAWLLSLRKWASLPLPPSPRPRPPRPCLPLPQARVPLGLKYGCDPDDAPALLAAAAALGLRVVGVSFHVGSSCKNLAAFDAAIATAARIFAAGAAAGHTMNLLDIGGGFTGRFDARGHVVFGDIGRTINAALAAHFPPEGGVRVIAEPGRYFAEAFATYACHVNGWRQRSGEAGERLMDYYITDGLYGSMNW